MSEENKKDLEKLIIEYKEFQEIKENLEATKKLLDEIGQQLENDKHTL